MDFTGTSQILFLIAAHMHGFVAMVWVFGRSREGLEVVWGLGLCFAAKGLKDSGFSASRCSFRFAVSGGCVKLI